jgi:hypothetical protein
MTCGPDPIFTPLVLLIAAIAYATRPENARPFAQQWYRGCGWFPSAERGPAHK